jgi:hypothetical protein
MVALFVWSAIKKLILMPEERDKNKRSMGVVTATVEDNCLTHGIRGRLKHEDILKMVALYSEDDKQSRIFGRFAHLVGLVFKNFNRKIHIIRPFRITKRDFVVVEALDPHTRNPDAVMWVGIDKNQTKFVIDELYGNFITAELAARIKEKAGGLRLISRIADPAAFSEDKHLLNAQGQTLASTLSNDYGISYLPGTKNRQRADRRIKDALDYELRGEEIVLAPELYIFDTCHRTIYEFEHYQWDEWRGRIAERKSPKEKPQDKDDHQIENLGRILLQEATFSPLPLIMQPQASSIKTARSFDPFD